MALCLGCQERKPESLSVDGDKRKINNCIAIEKKIVQKANFKNLKLKLELIG